MGQKRKREEGTTNLLQSLADHTISVSGRPLSQDLVNLILRLWACARLQKIKDARAWVCDMVGISRRKMQELVTEAYKTGKMAKQKEKKRKWTKPPKIPHDVLNETAAKIREWNKAGPLTTIPKLQQWLKEERGLEVPKTQLIYYLQKMGFEWGKVKRKGLIESEGVIKKRREYLTARVVRRAEGPELKPVFIDETYVHQNHAPNFTWHLKPEGQGVGTPMGKGQRLVLLHAGSADGWVEGAMSTWFEDLCKRLKEPVNFIMDNAGSQ